MESGREGEERIGYLAETLIVDLVSGWNILDMG